MNQTTEQRFVKKWGTAVDALADLIHTGTGEKLPPALAKGLDAAKKAMNRLMEAESEVGEWIVSRGRE